MAATIDRPRPVPEQMVSTMVPNSNTPEIACRSRQRARPFLAMRKPKGLRPLRSVPCHPRPTRPPQVQTRAHQDQRPDIEDLQDHIADHVVAHQRTLVPQRRHGRETDGRALVVERSVKAIRQADDAAARLVGAEHLCRVRIHEDQQSDAAAVIEAEDRRVSAVLRCGHLDHRHAGIGSSTACS